MTNKSDIKSISKNIAILKKEFKENLMEDSFLLYRQLNNESFNFKFDILLEIKYQEEPKINLVIMNSLSETLEYDIISWDEYESLNIEFKEINNDLYNNKIGFIKSFNAKYSTKDHLKLTRESIFDIMEDYMIERLGYISNTASFSIEENLPSLELKYLNQNINSINNLAKIKKI